MIPEEYELNINLDKQNELDYIWQGGKVLANSSEDTKELLVTRRMYDEHGHGVCKKKFDVYHNQ
jgi:actin-related protein